MFEPKQKNKPSGLDGPELDKLRETVLRWVDVKNKSDQKKKIVAKKITPKPEPIAKPVAEKKKPVVMANQEPVTMPAVGQSAKTDKIEKIQPIKYKQPRRSRQNPIKKIIVALLILALLAFAIFGGYLYLLKPTSSNIKLITKIVPYPVGIVNWRLIYYYDWLNQSDSLEQFYSFEKNQNVNLVTPNRNDIEKHILSILIEKELVNQLAKGYQLSISSQELNSQLANLVNQIGGQEKFESEIKNLYNWNIDEFKKEILNPLLLKKKLSLAITLDDGLNQDTRIRAEKILKNVKTGNQSFEEIAFAQSQDPTALKGGDLGYFGPGQFTPDFETAAFSLEEGQVSDLVKTEFGYHIIKLEEKLLDQDGNIDQVRARHILIRGTTLPSYLNEIKNNKVIFTFINL